MATIPFKIPVDGHGLTERGTVYVALLLGIITVLVCGTLWLRGPGSVQWLIGAAVGSLSIVISVVAWHLIEDREDFSEGID